MGADGVHPNVLSVLADVFVRPLLPWKDYGGQERSLITVER